MASKRSHYSHFSQLLSTFKVSGTEMADILHIDSSLVSKWKNNKRNLKGNSPMLNSIAEYFVSLDALANYSNLKSLLGDEYENLDSASASQLRHILKTWLTSSVETDDETLPFHDLLGVSKKGKTSTHLQFSGSEGKREAILGLLKTAAALPPGQELWCVMNDSQFWFIEEEDYIPLWEQANLDFLNAGNTIHIIHSLERRYDLMAKSLICWLPLYLTGKATPYFSPATQYSHSQKSVILLKDKLLLYQETGSDEYADGITLAFNSAVLLQEAYQLLQRSFRVATPLLTPYYRYDNKKYAAFLASMVNLDEDQYVFMRFPFVNVLSNQQIETILEENEIDMATKAEAMATCKALKADMRHYGVKHFRYLISKSQLEALLAQERIILDTLSFFSGKPLYISNETFRSLLRELSETLLRPSHRNIHEITLLEDVHANRLNGLNMFVKKNTCISIFNSPHHMFDEDAPLLLTTTEAPIIHSLFTFCDQLWNHALPQKREKPYVSRQLQIMTGTIFPPEKP